jgi:UDP:flavonoid glycosyltransferase YjiC (YdhE family)
LFAWELGAGAGHVTRFLPTALLLQERDHEVVFAVRDLPRTKLVLGRHRVPLHQSPLWLRDNPGLPPAVSYAELLLRFGYQNVADLKAMVRGWLTLYEMVRPDLVVIDHGPTALMAAMVGGVRRATIGTGFFLPPRLYPLPSFRPWLDVPADRLQRSEREVLAVVNGALLALGAERRLSGLAELFEADEAFLCTVPELDHYPRDQGHYWGPAFDALGGDEPQWPSSDGPKIFVYMPGTWAGLPRLLQELAGLRASVLLYLPGLALAAAASYAGPSMRISARPLRMAQVLRECDLVVCHAGHGTVAAALLAGRPLLVIPEQVEQLLVARAVVKLGAARMVNPDSRPKFSRLIQGILSDGELAQAARGFATKYSHFGPAQPYRSIAERCEALMRLDTGPNASAGPAGPRTRPAPRP